MMPDWGMPKTTSDQGAARVGRPLRRQTPKTPGFKTMTSEIISLAAQFQLWINQLVARHLAAEAAKIVR
jgi:hypothetical protein